jgi:hypothetical protein
MINVGEVVGEFCELRLYPIDIYLKELGWCISVVVVLGLCFGGYRSSSFAPVRGGRAGERTLQHYNVYHTMSCRSAASSLYFTNSKEISSFPPTEWKHCPDIFWVDSCQYPLAVTVERLICSGDIETNPGPYHSLPIKINIIKPNSIPKIIIYHTHNNKTYHKLN